MKSCATVARIQAEMSFLHSVSQEEENSLAKTAPAAFLHRHSGPGALELGGTDTNHQRNKNILYLLEQNAPALHIHKERTTECRERPISNEKKNHQL